jgi:hypothetical protein
LKKKEKVTCWADIIELICVLGPNKNFELKSRFRHELKLEHKTENAIQHEKKNLCSDTIMDAKISAVCLASIPYSSTQIIASPKPRATQQNSS